MENEILALQQQLNRLNYIIDLLIKENQELRSILPETLAPGYTSNPVTQHLLKENMLNWLISSNAGEGNALNQPVSSNLQKEIVLNELIASNLKKENILNQFVSSNHGKESALNKPISSSLQQENVLNQPVSSNPENGHVLNQLILPDQEKEVQPNQLVSSNNNEGNATNQPNASINQKEDTEKHVNVFEVLKTLRIEKVTASRQSVKNSLKLLQHLADNPKNNTRQLSKATGMSASGLSKRLSALRKQGYITKLKVRHYVLTQKGLEVLGR